jgi:hypothetical protein
MRLSEKTIELNVCSQFGSLNIPPLIWFGLTQKQEARAGFDACTRLRGRLLILQFKASNYDVNGMRRFRLNHNQLTALRQRCRPYKRAVFYVFPLIGNSHELAQNQNFLSTTWLLDVNHLQSLSAPTKMNGQPRKDQMHNAYVRPGFVIIHSEPQEYPLISAAQFDLQGSLSAGIILNEFRSFDQFWEFRRHLIRHSVALFVFNL